MIVLPKIVQIKLNGKTKIFADEANLKNIFKLKNNNESKVLPQTQV